MCFREYLDECIEVDTLDFVYRRNYSRNLQHGTSWKFAFRFIDLLERVLPQKRC